MPPRRPLKGIVDFTDHFGRLPAWGVLGFLLSACGLVAWVWDSAWVGLGFGVFALGDGVMLAAFTLVGADG
jgi:hypothetical protein